MLFCLTESYAQNDDIKLPSSLRTHNSSTSGDSDVSQRSLNYYVGCNVNSNFGYNFAISPEVGIKPLRWLGIGVAPRYELSVGSTSQTGRYTTHAFGVGAFVSGTISNYILLRVGYEFLNYPTNLTIVEDASSSRGYSVENERDNLHAVSLSFGFQTSIANNVYLYAMYTLYPYITDNDYYGDLPMFARVGIQYDF